MIAAAVEAMYTVERDNRFRQVTSGGCDKKVLCFVDQDPRNRPYFVFWTSVDGSLAYSLRMQPHVHDHGMSPSPLGNSDHVFVCVYPGGRIFHLKVGVTRGGRSRVPRWNGRRQEPEMMTTRTGQRGGSYEISRA
jgi:hypothetical protein